jgi:hypothetical protein
MEFDAAVPVCCLTVQCTCSIEQRVQWANKVWAGSKQAHRKSRNAVDGRKKVTWRGRIKEENTAENEDRGSGSDRRRLSLEDIFEVFKWQEQVTQESKRRQREQKREAAEKWYEKRVKLRKEAREWWDSQVKKGHLAAQGFAEWFAVVPVTDSDHQQKIEQAEEWYEKQIQKTTRKNNPGVAPCEGSSSMP